MTEQTPKEASSTPGLWQSNPVTLRAMQYHEKEVAALAAWLGPSRVKYRPRVHLTQIWVAANKAWLPLEEGEWVLQDELGFYPCKDVIFRKKYHKVADRDDPLVTEKKSLTVPASEWDRYTFCGDSTGMWLELDNQYDRAATKRWEELTAGYDTVHIDHTK